MGYRSEPSRGLMDVARRELSQNPHSLDIHAGGCEERARGQYDLEWTCVKKTKGRAMPWTIGSRPPGREGSVRSGCCGLDGGDGLHFRGECLRQVFDGLSHRGMLVNLLWMWVRTAYDEKAAARRD